MNFHLFGLNITIEVESGRGWQGRLIEKAKILAMNEGMALEGQSWKIERIKAIRLVRNPYPRHTTFFKMSCYRNGYASKQSSLTAAKEFVEQYWLD